MPLAELFETDMQIPYFSRYLERPEARAISGSFYTILINIHYFKNLTKQIKILDLL